VGKLTALQVVFNVDFSNSSIKITRLIPCIAQTTACARIKVVVIVVVVVVVIVAIVFLMATVLALISMVLARAFAEAHSGLQVDRHKVFGISRIQSSAAAS